MKKFKTYFLLLISAFVYFVISNLVSSKISYTINFFDTYIKILSSDFYKSFFILCLTTGLIYLVLDKFEVKINSILSRFHILSTILLLVTLAYFVHKNFATQTIVISKDSTNLVDYSYYLNINLILIIMLQFFFFINIFTAQIKNLQSK